LISISSVSFYLRQGNYGFHRFRKLKIQFLTLVMDILLTNRIINNYLRFFEKEKIKVNNFR
jgi:hypothetical protein